MSKTTTRNAAAKRKHDEMSGSPAPPSQQVPRGWQNPANAHNTDPMLYQGFAPTGIPSNPPSVQQYYPQYYNLRPPPQGPPQPAQAPTPPTRTNTRTTAQKPTGKDKEGGLDRQNVNQLNDALAAGGVSLREEEEYANASRRNIAQSKYQGEDRTKKQEFLDISTLMPTMEAIAKGHGVQTIPPEVADYLALALRARLSGLIEEMSKASKHRWASVGGVTSTPTLYEDGKTPIFDRTVRRDVGKQLQLLEKIEKDEELRLRRERKERESKVRAAMGTVGANVDGDEDDDGPPKKKKKKADGPGVTAKNMSEETKKKLSNSIANQAAGFMGKYAWMHSGSSSLPTRPRPTKNSNGGSNAATNAPSPTASGSGWARPYVPSKLSKQIKAAEAKREITARDALFVVERERGHGGGRGTARGWAV